MNSQAGPSGASCAIADRPISGDRPATTTRAPFLEEPPRRGQADAAGSPHDQASAAVEPAGSVHGLNP